MACRGIYRKPCRCYFLNSVPAFHGIALCSRNNIIRCNIHGSGKGSGIIVSIKFPPAIVYPMSALITVIAPIPVRKPVGVPDTPCCRCILRIRGDGWNGKTRIRIRGSGIRRNIFIQIHNICDEAGFCSGSSVEGCADRNPAGFGGSMPFNPDNLGTALWNHNVVYRIGSAVR